MDKANSVTDTRWRLISGGRSVSLKARYCASVLLLHSFRRGGNRCLWPLMSQLASKSEELLDFLRCWINHQIFTRNRQTFNPFPQRRMQIHFLYFIISVHLINKPFRIIVRLCCFAFFFVIPTIVLTMRLEVDSQKFSSFWSTEGLRIFRNSPLNSLSSRTASLWLLQLIDGINKWCQSHYTAG